MIKLKDILTEIETSTHRWQTPSGTPTPLVTILHHVIGEILKRGKKPEEYLKFSKTKDGRFWLLENLHNQKKGLSFSIENNYWYSLDPEDNEPLNSMELSAIIKGWTF